MKKGLTAIEIIVTLAIIAILVGVIVPTLSKYLPGIKLNGSTKTLVANLREAQEKAVTEQNQYLVRFSPADIPPTYKLITIVNSVETEIRQVSLQSDQTLNLEPTITGNQIIFSPDGGPSSSGDITISNGAQNKIISVSPAGFIAIE
jgi:prepilin-type N-terminal cleavage/methylation domain-containing protein